MKGLLIFILLICTAKPVCCQKINTPYDKVQYEQLFAKSKNNRMGATLLLVAGAGLCVLGASTFEIHFSNDNSRNTASYVMMGAGTAMVLTSIPLFSRAGKLRRKARMQQAGGD